MKTSVWIVWVGLVVSCLNTAAAELQTRWVLEDDGTLHCDLNNQSASDADHPVEFVTHGRRVIMQIRFPVDDGAAPYVDGPRVQWPIFKSNVRDKSLVIPAPQTRSTDLPTIRVNDNPYALGRRTAYRYNGFFQVVYESNQGIQATRTLFPSIDQRVALQEWALKNTASEPLTVQAPEVLETLWQRQAVDGKDWLIDYVVTGVPRQRLAPGQTVRFAVAYTAHPQANGPLKIDLEAERRAHQAIIDHAQQNLILQTPDPLINRAFDLAKIRTLLSNIETRAGILNTTGSMAYYCGFWANDNAEYACPFIPLLGNEDIRAGIDTMYRVWLGDIAKYTLQDKQITGSFESYNLYPYQRGRGDEAMIIYGLSYYLLALGDRQRAEEMWPLVERCADYLHMNRNADGVIASRTDELEGRLPTGKANLSTSVLAYGGLTYSARLARSLNKPDLAQRYADFADELEEAIEDYFGHTVEGYDTYRYYAGGDLLRGWISLPLVVGIERRQEQTLAALFSPKLWLEDAETQAVNLKAVSTETTTRWARETYYALLAAFRGDRTELALEKTRTVLRSHVLGTGGPFADEDSIDLLSPSILYGRVITEGLFGIEPWDFKGFRCRPRLPAAWPEMELRRISLLGQHLDLAVRRVGDEIQLTVTVGQEVRHTQTGPEGTIFTIPL